MTDAITPEQLDRMRLRHKADEAFRGTFGPNRGLQAYYDRAALLRALDEAQEELSTWQSVFPDIAPDRVLPDRSKLEAELLAMAEENARLREAFSGPAAWLDSWAQHVGNCKGGYVCTCGLTLARTEARGVLIEPGQ